MNIIIWLITGGLIGGLAGKFVNPGSQQDVLLDVLVGIVGAMLGGWLLAPLFGSATINQKDFSLPSLVVSLLGAIGLLVLVRILRRGAV